MNKTFLWACLPLAFTACAVKKNNVASPENKGISVKYASYVNEKTAYDILSVIASDAYEGRETAKPGGWKAAEYIVEKFKSLGLEAPVKGSYLQHVELSELSKRSKFEPGVKADNVLGFIEGSDPKLKKEVLVLSAHYDHIGIDPKKTGDQISNGADDNGSGTTALIMMAEAFSKAKKDGHGPKRSILFLAVTGEEKGLLGSEYYSKHPIFPLENTIADVNTDMIGRVDDAHTKNPDYVYLIGSKMLSSQLDSVCIEANDQFGHLTYDLKYNDPNDPERIYYRSDHYNFAKNGIPSVFFFSGVHADYHKVSDEVSKIDFPLLTKRAKLIYHIAWDLANMAHKPEVNMDGKGNPLK